MMASVNPAAQPQRRDAVIPARWVEFHRSTHIPAAVRHGDRLYLTGHTGDADDGTFTPDDEAQIRQTFRNIADTLATANAALSDVIELTTYHVGLHRQADVLLRVAAEFLDDPYPAWTAVGVTELFEPDALVEIQCVAALPTQYGDLSSR
jgi:enamine deaminase RidA (YjgF/YER057c/UK114 family)